MWFYTKKSIFYSPYIFWVGGKGSEHPVAIQRGIHELYYRYSRSHATQTKTKKTLDGSFGQLHFFSGIFVTAHTARLAKWPDKK